jgi:hypothetical protein
MFTPDLLQFFMVQGREWAASMHSDLYARGRPLPPPLKQLYEPFFGADTLSRIRVLVLPAIPNPHFYATLASRGLPPPLDFTEMAGITFVDTVLLSQSRADLTDAGLVSILFHEAVHVVQYEHLGVEHFMREYVQGWARNGFQYRLIPIEQQAYGLQDRFLKSPNVPFSVHDEVGGTGAPGPAA